MAIATELGNRIASLRLCEIPPAAVRSAKMAILDTIGVTLAGGMEQAPQIAARVLDAEKTAGNSLIFGSTRRTSCLNAALINGVSSHVLDFDDCSDTMGGHPSVAMLPAILALAEEKEANGADVLLAYIAGFETETRIARGVNFFHYTKGWHPTSTLGIFGAVSGCSRLLNLPAEKIATGLALGISMASGVKANFGTMTKSLHVGHCCRDGLFAALLAKEGYTANPQAFEHKQGFFEVFNGAGNYDGARILEHWANPLDIIEPGVAIKQYPCCGSTHPALDAMIEIVEAHRIALEEVSQIDVWTHARRLAHTNRPDPRSDLEAKFSVQYCVARAFLHSRVILEHFEANASQDTDVRKVMRQIRVQPYTEDQFPAENHFGGEVRIVLTNGQVYSAKVQNALGRTSANPLPAERVRRKFENCAGRVLASPYVARIHDAVAHLEELPNIREFLNLIAEGTAAAKTAATLG